MCCGLPFKSIQVECVRAQTNTKSIVIEEFFDSMKERFALIDVKKNQKSLSKKQIADINITNEIKIITASDEVHNLWKEVILSQMQGLLINPETLTMWKDSKGWDQEKDGVIMWEFFKWMENTTETDMEKMALHLLNRTPKRKHLHPKVMIKKISGVVVDCYNTKEWLEWMKRKHAVRRFLYQEKQSLGSFDSNTNYKPEARKNFKRKFDITKATKMLFLTAPKEEFFS